MLGALFGFTGRLSRPGYWEVLLSVLLVDVALVVGRMFVADGGLPGGVGPSSELSRALLGVIPWVLVIFTVWCVLAAAVKRLHDRGRTGFLILVALIPVIGWLWLLVDLFLLEGTEGRNRYGKVPHGPDAPGPGRFEWDAAPAAVDPAHVHAAPMTLDPEPPAWHAPPAEAHEPPVRHEPEPQPEPHLAEAPVEAPHAQEVHAQEAHAEAVHAAEPHAEPAAPEPVVHQAVAEEAHPAPEPPGHHTARAEDPYDPLNAPLVLNIR